MIEAIWATGSTTKDAAVEAVSVKCGKSKRTLYDWMGLIDGIAEDDRLAYIVPKNRLADRTTPEQDDMRAFFEHLKSQFLQFEGPTFAQCYRDAVDEAKAKGWPIPHQRTALRRIEREVPHVTRVYAREGEKGMLRCYPAQIRDRTGMTALEGVNADCHKIDVFVSWPDGTITRPQIVAFQDLYSGKILSWRVDHDPNKVMVMAAFIELVETWGIPRHCLFDNGREFANKWMTGGTPTRFRFKVRDEEPMGVLPLLGIKVHWATPGHGQAKPIERTFRDLASDVAKDPRFQGAYVGNRPDAKPENYGSRAIPVATFLKVLDEGIRAHNARDGRLSPTCLGRSFDVTFQDSYETAPIRKATEEQRRLWLMGHHFGTLNAQNGQLVVLKNHYHSEWMSQHPGRKVVARFNPEDLWAGVYIYDIDGTYLGFAECRQKVGFFDVTGAQEQARKKRRIKKAEKQLLEAHRPVPIREIAACKEARAVPAAPAEPLEAKVVSPVFGAKRSARPNPVAYEAPVNPDIEAAQEAMILSMSPAKSRTDAEPKADDGRGTPAERFFWAQSVLARSEAGEAIGEEEARQVTEYVKSAEYQGLLDIYEAYGEAGVR